MYVATRYPKADLEIFNDTIFDLIGFIGIISI